jgi:hypothetical protein
MFNVIFIGPYFSNSLAGTVYRDFIEHNGSDHQYAALNYTDLSSPIYNVGAEKEMAFLNLSTSKQAYQHLSGNPVAVIFVDELTNMDPFMAQLYQGGIIPSIIVVCGDFSTQKYAEVVKKYSATGVEIIPLNDSGLEGTPAALWNPGMPLKAATTNIVPGKDMLFFDRTMTSLQSAIQALEPGKTLYVYDPLSYLQLNTGSYIAKAVKEKGGELVSFTFHTREELMALADDKSVYIGSPRMALFLSAMVESVDQKEMRYRQLVSDVRLVLHTKYPQQGKPEAPEGRLVTE